VYFKKGGRKKTLCTDPKVLTAKKMHKNHDMGINDICKMLNISRATFYRYLALDK
jgi:ACT domain-containing protein